MSSPVAGGPSQPALPEVLSWIGLRVASFRPQDQTRFPRETWFGISTARVVDTTCDGRYPPLDEPACALRFRTAGLVGGRPEPTYPPNARGRLPPSGTMGRRGSFQCLPARLRAPGLDPP